jgi:hypothetical protein
MTLEDGVVVAGILKIIVNIYYRATKLCSALNKGFQHTRTRIRGSWILEDR